MQVQERDYSGLIELDTETLDPNFSYRWVYKGPTKVARAKAKGYVVVDANDEDIKNLIGEDIASQDGTYTVGDVLLMKIRKIRFKERRRTVAEKTKSRLSSQRRKFKRNAQEKQEQSGYDIEVITKKDPSDNKD